MAGPVGVIRVLAEIDEASGGLFAGRPATMDAGTRVWLVSQEASGSGSGSGRTSNDWEPLTGSNNMLDGWAVRGVYETFALEPVSCHEFGSKRAQLSSYLYAAIDSNGGNWLVAFTADASHAQAFVLDADGHCCPSPAGDELLKTLEITSITINVEYEDGSDSSSIYNAWEFMMLLRGRNSVL